MTKTHFLLRRKLKLSLLTLQSANQSNKTLIILHATEAYLFKGDRLQIIVASEHISNS